MVNSQNNNFLKSFGIMWTIWDRNPHKALQKRSLVPPSSWFLSKHKINCKDCNSITATFEYFEILHWQNHLRTKKNEPNHSIFFFPNIKHISDVDDIYCLLYTESHYVSEEIDSNYTVLLLWCHSASIYDTLKGLLYQLFRHQIS